MTFRIQRVIAEGFRGYGERIEFDCSADVVVLVGPNGWGKTSFFDALTWCFFGEIPRLLGSRDAVGADLIRNRFAQDVPPNVSVILRSDDEVVVVARDDDGVRVVTDAGELAQEDATEWIGHLFRETIPDGYEEEEEGIHDDPKASFLRCHLLSQDQMVKFLRETNPRNRFDAIVSLLGLDLVKAFYEHLGGVRRDADERVEEARRRERQVEQRLESIRSDVEGIQGLDESSPTLDALLGDYIALAQRARESSIPYLTGEGPATADEVATRASDIAVRADDAARRAEARAEEMLALRESVASATENERLSREAIAERDGLEPITGDLQRATTELQGEIDRLSIDAAEVRQRLEAEDQRRRSLASFLRLGLEHTDDGRCPLCNQEIALSELRDRVTARLDALPQTLLVLQEQNEISDSSLRSSRERLEATQRKLQQNQREIQELNRRLAAESSEALALRARLEDAGVDNPSQALAEQHRLAVTEASSARAIAEMASLVARRADTFVARSRLPNLQLQQSQLEADLQKAQTEAHQAVRVRNALDEVITAARRSERDLVREMFEGIEPTMDALYGRLRPHPVLDSLRLDIGSFDERGEVRFVAYSPSAEANVTNIFSSAQLNAVAVCIFLAMNLSVVRSATAFALLDDPIQNMDDFNVLGLLDLLRGLLGERQFVLSTHDDQIGELLRRKLRPVKQGDQTITHKFVAYGAAGPVVSTIVDEYSESSRVLEASREA
jgi:hypothetical protein